MADEPAAPRAHERTYGFSDEELAAQPTVFREGLFAGQVALVSGAGSGIGKAIAFLFARLGASLVICGRDPTKLAQTERALRGFGAAVLSRSMSIRDPEQVRALMDDAWGEFGRMDVLVNNAGGQFPAKALDFTVKGWNAVIDTNLNGTWYMMQQAALRWRDRQQPGCVVNIVADIWRGLPDIAHTCAARAGVIYLSKTVAVEWAPLQIRVNCVAPGCVETPAFALYPPEGAATYYEANPLRKAGDVQDVAEACVYLAAASGKFVTGEVITVDGGQQLWGDPWPLGRPQDFRIR
jgi:NAD(P)-dependent dehydrogenase (short-subunit alcohol dehydrogenase family)